MCSSKHVVNLLKKFWSFDRFLKPNKLLAYVVSFFFLQKPWYLISRYNFQTLDVVELVGSWKLMTDISDGRW